MKTVTSSTASKKCDTQNRHYTKLNGVRRNTETWNTLAELVFSLDKVDSKHLKERK